MSGEIWITGGTAVTMNAAFDVVENAAVVIRDGRIAAVRKDGKAPSGARVVDARGCLVVPGFVNIHTHSPMTLLRGVADDLPLKRWLGERIWPLEKKLASGDFAYFGTLLASLEMIRSGTTTFNDMYFFEDRVAQASDEAGLRAVCGQTLVELSDVDRSGDRLFEKLEAYLESVKRFPRVIPAIAPHSVYGVRPETWRKLVDFAAERDLRVHTHIAEVQDEVDECLRDHGKTPVKFFEDMGLFERCRVIAAHMTCLTEEDIAIAGRRRVGVAHNIDSNLKLGARIAPVVELLREGARVGLGTDSVASNNNLDLLQELDTAAKVQSFRLGPGALPAREAFRLITSEAAAALGLESEIGSLEVGKQGDVVAVDATRPHLVPLYDPYSHLVYSASGADVKHTVVAGRVLMEDYRVKSLDEGAIVEEARHWGRRIADSLR